jgi:hypothetical protein
MQCKTSLASIRLSPIMFVAVAAGVTRFFLWAVFLKRAKVAQNLGRIFFTQSKLCIKFNKQWAGTQCELFFLQNHLVTMITAL